MILIPEHHWECPNCPATYVSHEARPHIPYHICRGLHGITAPYIPKGSKAKVETREREDYVGDEMVTTDGEGRPVMSVVTIREDGQDCAVLAPSASVAAKVERD